MTAVPHDLKGSLTVGFVVFGGLAVSLYESELSGAPRLWILLLGGLYLTLMLTLGETLEDASDGWRPWLYFGLELALASGIFFTFAGQNSFHVAWLILMPLVSQARLFLHPLGSAAVCAASLVIVNAHLHWLGIPLASRWSALIGVTTAIAFVLLFTDIAARERTARAESERLGRELAEANRKLGEYAVQAEELATARERGRLAREIHDSLGHYLTVVNVQLEAALAVFDRTPQKARGAVRKALQLNQDGLQEIRRSVAALRTAPLENRPFHRAIEELVGQNAEAGIATRFEILGETAPLDAETELTLFRAAQEGLTNVRRHSKAQSAELLLDYEHPSRVRLILQDDGIGLQDSGEGFGLLGVRERTQLLGGHLTLEPAAGQGLRLIVEIPR